MKKLIILASLTVALASCGGESTLDKLSKTAKDLKEVKQNVKNASSLVSSAEDMQKNMVKLKEMTPISKDVMKAWMPESIGDLKRTKYTIGKQMGIADISSLDLKFENEDKENRKSVKLKVIDCAGEAAALMSMQLLVTRMDIDSEDEQGYERTDMFGDQKILVKHKNAEHGNRTNFNYQINDRLAVEAKGVNMDADELWSYLKETNVEALLN